MPLFDFECVACGRTHEELVLGPPTEQVCPFCGSSSLRKLISAPAPPGKSQGVIRSARRQAAAEGHLSHFSASERRRLLR